MLNERPRQQLQIIITRFGHSICDNPKRCEAMLRDLCPEHKREVNLLITALKEKIAHDLLNRSAFMPLEATLKSLSQRLQDNHGTAEQFANWAVESWALSLSVMQKPLTNQSVKSITNNSTVQTATSASPKQQRIGKFIVRDGITLDTETNLIWCRFVHGQTWHNNMVVGDAKAVGRKVALEIAKQFNQQGGYQNYTDWRLPTLDEINSLIDKVKGKSGNYIDADVFPENPRQIWTSSPFIGGLWTINFSNGNRGRIATLSHNFIRLVHNKTPKTAIDPQPIPTQIVTQSIPQQPIAQFTVQDDTATPTQPSFIKNVTQTSANTTVIPKITQPIKITVTPAIPVKIITPQSRFIVQDGIAIDTQTDLMWCRFAYGQTWQNNTVVGYVELVSWKTAFKLMQQFNQQGGYQGYTDWRLPTIDELKTLIDKTNGKVKNYIDEDIFPNNFKYFWSSSFRDKFSKNTLLVNFYHGNSDYYDWNGSFAFRLVRNKTLPPKSIQPMKTVVVSQKSLIKTTTQAISQSIPVKTIVSKITQPAKVAVTPQVKHINTITPVISQQPTQLKIGKFIVQDGIATDTETGLMWCRFAYGQRWENGTAKGDAKLVDWKTAFEVAKQFNQQGGYAGYTDWRLPAIDELETLIDKVKGKKGNYIDANAFIKNDGTHFWSSSPNTIYSGYAWFVYFYTGVDYYTNEGRSFAVRLVRNE